MRYEDLLDLFSPGSWILWTMFSGWIPVDSHLSVLEIASQDDLLSTGDSFELRTTCEWRRRPGRMLRDHDSTMYYLHGMATRLTSH